MEFQQIKTGKDITKIDENIIEKIAQIKAFKNPEINKLLWEHHKALLRRAQKKNSSKEVGFFWDLDNLEKAPLEIIGSINGFNISSNESVNRLVKDSYNLLNVVVMHNHPRNGLFSSADIRSFIDFNSIFIMTAVCNDGTIYMLRKEENFNPFLMEDYYNEGVKQSEMATKSDLIRKATKLHIDLKDKARLSKIPLKPYYYGIKNIAKHSKEIGITYRCSVKRK